MTEPKWALALAVSPFNLKVRRWIGIVSIPNSQFELPRQIHQIRGITLPDRYLRPLPDSTFTMPLPFAFLRRVCRCGDRRLGAKRDEEVSASKDGSLQADDSASNQAAAVYFTQYPNKWAKIRLAHIPQYYY
jgi:hypothetical protein